MSEYYKKIDNSICPYCGQKMRNVRDGTKSKSRWMSKQLNRK